MSLVNRKPLKRHVRAVPLAAAGLALDAGGGDRVGFVELDPQRQGEGPPAYRLPTARGWGEGRGGLREGASKGGATAVPRR